ncbi:MAG: DUF5671 domain-containing protein [Chloroflexi bacterium]|nr:DUF5671 domain-containing protein [Chloroflexota bacterium]
MQTARRIYVYLMSGISLGALVTGLTMLVGVVLSRIGLDAPGEVIAGRDETLRQQLTVATALIVVSLPVWLIHWFVAERSTRPDRPDGSVERNAAERGLYFALALGALMVVGAFGIASAIEGTVLRASGARSGPDVADNIGLGVIALVAWGYHFRIRERDWDRGALSGWAAALPRAYRYAAAVIGLLFLLGAVAELVDLVGRLAVGAPSSTFGDGPWWAYPLASAVAGAVAGGAVWIGHWSYSARLLADPGACGASERTARLRLAAFVAVIVATAASTLLLTGTALGAAIALPIGISETRNGAEAIGSVAIPLASAVPFALAWWLHGRWLYGEPIARAAEGGIATVDRLRLYPAALVGLAFGAVGMAWMIDLLVAGLFGPRGFGDRELWGEQLAEFGPFALLGTATWIWRWAAVVRRESAAPAAEAESTTRRATLLIAVAAGLLAGIGAAGVILYRAFGALFGITFRVDAIADLSLPIGILVVAVVVAVGHGGVLRRDARLRDAEAPSAEPPGAPDEVMLRLAGPAADMESAVGVLREALPPGYELEVTRRDPPAV